MAKSKSSPTMTAKSKTASKSKGPTAMRDIKPKNAKSPFTIHQLEKDEDMLEVEPLNDEEREHAEETEEGDFEVSKVERDYQPIKPPHMTVTSVSQIQDDIAQYEAAAVKKVEDQVPKEIVKVKFSKFVQLVASHDFGDVIEANADEDIIMSSNLLTELAGSQDKRGERKIPLVFLVGIAIGVVLTYILFST